LLTAVMYNNPNETINDDDYDYEKTSIPFSCEPWKENLRSRA